MPFQLGVPNTSGGRPKGVPNKATREARRDIAEFVNGNAHRLIGWLDAIAVDNPMAAFDRYMSVVEFALPKLARQEITGKDGERLQINVVTGVQAVDAAFDVVGAIDADCAPETGMLEIDCGAGDNGAAVNADSAVGAVPINAGTPGDGGAMVPRVPDAILHDPAEDAKVEAMRARAAVARAAKAARVAAVSK